MSKYVEAGGLSWQLHETVFWELATHHRSGPPGLRIEKDATVVPTRVLRRAKEASRGLNIFFFVLCKDKIMEKPLREGAREQPRGKGLGDKERA